LSARDLAIDARATVGVDPDGPLSVTASWQPSDLGATMQRLTIDVPVSGTAANGVEGNATRAGIADGSGHLSVDRAKLTIASRPVRLAQAGRIDVDRGSIRATPIVFATGQSTLTIDGALQDAASTGRLALTLNGSLEDLAFIHDAFEPSARETSPQPPA